MGKIRVLVVDDSAFMRKVIPQMLQEDEEIEVIGTARDGNEAFKMAAELKPDVVTLDIEMPKMDGLTTLGYIMSEYPVPVIMLSAYTPKGAETTLKALEYGALDFVCKPSGEISIDIKKVKDELVQKIKAAGKSDISKLTFVNKDEKKQPEILRDARIEAQSETKSGDFDMVVIATSTGGPRALADFVPAIPRNIPAAVLIVQHMSEGFTKTLADRLNAMSFIKVKEAENGEVIKQGTAYVAPGNHHMEIEKEGRDYRISLNQKPTRLGVRPSADITMASVAEKFSGKMIGIILTGMGRDGTDGAAKMKEKKAVILTQDKESCVIYGMPKTAAEKGLSDAVVPLDKMKDALMDRLLRDRAGK